MKIIISTLPETLVNISKCYNEDINSDNENMKYSVEPEKIEFHLLSKNYKLHIL
jgi:hypothetical protein